MFNKSYYKHKPRLYSLKHAKISKIKDIILVTLLNNEKCMPLLESVKELAEHGVSLLSGNPLDLYSGDTWLGSRPRHLLS